MRASCETSSWWLLRLLARQPACSRMRVEGAATSAHAFNRLRDIAVRGVLLLSESVTVAVVNSQVVSVLALAQHDGISWLTQLYLHPAHVAQGIGSQLLAHAIATALPPIRLFTFQQNVGARRFYERNGFVPTEFTDGSSNEEQCPDVLYELASPLRGVA